jgi:hypothetical protein
VELASSVSKHRRCCRLRYGSPSCRTCADDGVRFDVYEFHRSGVAVSKGGTHVFFVNDGDFCEQSGPTNDLFESCSPKNRTALVETDGPGSRPGWPREFAPVGAAPDIRPTSSDAPAATAATAGPAGLPSMPGLWVDADGRLSSCRIRRAGRACYPGRIGLGPGAVISPGSVMTGATARLTLAPDRYHRKRKVAPCLRPAPPKRIGPSRTCRRRIAWSVSSPAGAPVAGPGVVDSGWFGCPRFPPN